MAKISGFGGNKGYQVDMCHGPLFSQIVKFVIPLLISGILQLLFHAADLIVIGRLASHKALAAIGATGSLTMLLINIFIGLSIGTNVLVARYIGEQSRKDISRTVHTAIMASLCGGTLLAITGILFAKPILKFMGTPEDILDMSALYMWIYFGGMPMIMLYNFGSAILRALGDTIRPFYYLLAGGIVNVLLNLFFVIVFHWDVAGVALATVISQAMAALLVFRVLHQMRGPCRVRWHVMRIEWKNLKEMMWIGIPAGFQASCFSLSNTLIQSSINTFGSITIAAMTACSSLEGVAFISMNAISQAAISFVGQNYGAKKFNRVKKSVNICILLGYICSFTASVILLIYGGKLLKIFNTNPEVIAVGIRRFHIMIPLLFVCAIMETITGALRGLGRSVPPTVITIFFVCIMRVIWIYTIFRLWPTLDVLLFSYPVTWILNAIGCTLLFRHIFKKLSASEGSV